VQRSFATYRDRVVLCSPPLRVAAQMAAPSRGVPAAAAHDAKCIGVESDGRATVTEEGQLEALLQSSAPLRVLTICALMYDAAVLSRVLCTRRPLLSTFANPLHHPNFHLNPPLRLQWSAFL
jgi:hypothetical protein